MADDKDIWDLRANAHISRDSRHQNLWDFGELSGTASIIPERLSSDVFAYLRHMKDFWRPQYGLEVPEEWTQLILPPEKDHQFPWRRVKFERWFPLSLISTIFSPISSELRLVPAAEFTNRCNSADYVGPVFPVRNPPQDSDYDDVSAMVNLLLCEHHPTGAFYCLVSLLRGTYGCQLKLFDVFQLILVAFLILSHRHPGLRFPHQFGDHPLDIDFALVPESQPTTECMIRRSSKTPLCFSSPALTIGIQLSDSDNKSCLTDEDLLHLARATQPHLEALLLARHQCYPKISLTSPAPFPPACIFVIAFRDMTIFIVAHIAYLRESTYRYQSLVVDQIPFPPYVPGDQGGVVARLRVIVSLLTIRSHTDRLASLWDDLIWGPRIFDAELAALRDCTGIVTPSPSEYEDPEVSMWGNMLDHIKLTPTGEEVATDISPSPSEVACSKELVDAWLPGIIDAEEVPETIISN
ncbi:hypothetical protein DFH07DRAFT_779537 [Mycena maculata]|uniref:Uncharacterized protein n=1 Tax=Mycena maculata TaxID=230809 RepID=A0AAD7I976_9AGAR|nr:hypothetical protein DFH07DRAFT_779537 [Mycena maculata]